MSLVSLRHVGSSRTRDWTQVPRIGSWILNHWTTRDVLVLDFLRNNGNIILIKESYALIWATLWTPLSMGFSRHEYWSGLSYPPPGDLPNQGSNPSLFCLLTAGRFFTTSATWEAHYIHYSSVTTTLSNQLWSVEEWTNHVFSLGAHLCPCVMLSLKIISVQKMVRMELKIGGR